MAATGTTFGQPAATTSTGFSFGGFGQQPAQQPQQTSLFSNTGAGTNQSLFGNPPASTGQFGSTLGGFGTTNQQQTLGTGFGAKPTTNFSFSQPASSSFSTFGTPATQATTGTTFGQPAATTTSSGFSFGGFGQQPAQQAQTSLFSNTGNAFGGANKSLFGNQPAAGGFGSTLGGFGTANQATLGGGFGAKPAAGFAFPQQQQQLSFNLQQPQQQLLPLVDESQAFQQSLFHCHKFGDERDNALSTLNFLQACWGIGKGHYSQSQAFPPVNYTPQNPFYRFKAVGYAFMYTDSNEDGHVVVNFKKPQDKLQAEETSIITNLQNLLGRPNIIIRFSGTKAIGDSSTMAVIYAEDRNTLRRVTATDMAAALCQPQFKERLESLGVTVVTAKVKPSPEQLKQYLENPPDGIDSRVWQQAQEDNPDPSCMIPTPLVGVEALRSRLDWQEKETLQHHARLKLIGEEVAGLLNRHANMGAELQQMKRKQVLLSHRLISIVCRQELMRKQGTTVQPDEEVLKKKLEELSSDLNSPTQFKGRLNELLSQIRLHKSTADPRSSCKYSIDPCALPAVKEFLSIEQESVKHLVATTRSDLETLKEMMEGVIKLTSKNIH